MQRDLVRRPPMQARRVVLPDTYWRRLRGVRSPADPGTVIDEIVVGPSGVYVRLHLAGFAAVDPDDLHVQACAARAVDAGLVVAAVLPARYRVAVRASVCACDADESGASIGTVEVLSPAAGRHTMQHAPRVLSTSEVAEVAAVLDARLEVVPVTEGGRRRGLRRRVLWWTAGSLTTAAAAAAVLTEAVGRTPWS
jgi:hypothetical protein